MSIIKEKSAKEINAEIKAKRHPGAIDPGDTKTEEVVDAPISAQDPNDARADESSEATETEEESSEAKE